MARFMTDWERRGFLTYPRLDGKPKAGTREEANWSKGWTHAQRIDIMTRESETAAQIIMESELGRETFAANYVPDRDENNLEF